MVRSGGHYRKRSRSRSLTPDHKRSKSSRDYDKDRTRRRSRSRDRLRRSRSRDRKKDKKISEPRVRSKPLNLKQRSRSGSKSKEKIVKKEDKKDTKDDEPFDPTNLDKVPGEDEEWVVTDVIEEIGVDDNGNPEEEYDYEADEDDRYSRRTSSSLNSHHSKSYDISEINMLETESKEVNVLEDNASCEQSITTTYSEINIDKNEEGNDQMRGQHKSLTVDKVKDMVSKIKEININHKENMESLEVKYEAENIRRRALHGPSGNNIKYSENIERLIKEQIKQSMRYEKELHYLKVKHETAKHNAELEAIRMQLEYWKNRPTT